MLYVRIILLTLNLIHLRQRCRKYKFLLTVYSTLLRQFQKITKFPIFCSIWCVSECLLKHFHIYQGGVVNILHVFRSHAPESFQLDSIALHTIRLIQHSRKLRSLINIANVQLEELVSWSKHLQHLSFFPCIICCLASDGNVCNSLLII